MAEPGLFRRLFNERKMWHADAVRAATHMDQLEEAVEIVADADFVAYEPTADLMIAIAEKEGVWTDRKILRLLSAIVDECSLEALAGVMKKVFSAETTRSAMWTILKACTMAKCIWVASDWRDLMTQACKDLPDEYFDFGVTKDGLLALFLFRQRKRQRDDDNDDDNVKCARTA